MIITRHKTINGGLVALSGSRRVTATISTEAVDRQGDIVRSQGCDATGFLATRSVLWNHDPSQPIARCVALDIRAGRINATAEFPEPGASVRSDETYNLIKAGVINATSIGFRPMKTKPLGAGKLDVIEWELLEFSFVSVPANADATISHRAAGQRSSGLTAAESANLIRCLSLLKLSGQLIPVELLMKLSTEHRRRIHELELQVLKGFFL